MAAERPPNLAALARVKGIGQEKLDRFGAEILAICRGDAPEPSGEETPGLRKEPVTPKASRVTRSRVDGGSLPADARRPASTTTIRQTLHVTPKAAPVSRASVEPAELSTEQLALDRRLRDWRREQAASSGLPTFFVLSDTALRKVVLIAPKNLQDLSGVAELGADKVARYGAAVLALCCET